MVPTLLENVGGEKTGLPQIFLGHMQQRVLLTIMCL
jgi:hypothetical protein